MSSSSDTTTWHPASILSPTPSPDANPFAIIVLNQPLELRSSIYDIIFHNAHFKIAADGGANRLINIKPTPSLDLIIGDLDSLSESSTAYWENQGVKIVKDHDQYSTDFGKAFNWIRKEIPEKFDIVVLGGLGGRLDQGLSVLHHLYMFQSTPKYADGKMFLLSSEAISFLLKAGKHRIKVKEVFEEVGVGLGKHIGIIPMKEASVISTKGLEWDVQDWKTEFGGLMSTSNLVREEWVDVETTKDVLFTIDLNLGEDAT